MGGHADGCTGRVSRELEEQVHRIRDQRSNAPIRLLNKHGVWLHQSLATARDSNRVLSTQRLLLNIILFRFWGNSRERPCGRETL